MPWIATAGPPIGLSRDGQPAFSIEGDRVSGAMQFAREQDARLFVALCMRLGFRTFGNEYGVTEITGATVGV